MRKIWNAIKRFFGFGEPEVRETEVDTIVGTKAEPKVVIKVDKVETAELPKGVKVVEEKETGEVVSEPKGITKVPKGIKKNGTASNKTGVTTGKKAEEKKAEPAKEEKPKAKKAPAKKKAKAKAKPANTEKAKTKKAWYNNGKEQKLIPVDQEAPKGWTKGRLPKKDK